jgi:acetylornithine/N-succinyldiaminopimelate aminotransferase
MNASQIIEQDNQYILGTYGRNQLALTSGQGARAKDADGKDYIDFTSGIGVNSLGFAHPAWVSAVTKQAGLLAHTSNLFYTTPAAELAQRLCEKTGLSKVFFSNSGAEANECAIKAARKYSFQKYGKGRNRIVSFVGSFHGRTMATLTATGQDRFHQYFDPFPTGFVYAKAEKEDFLQKAQRDVCAVLLETIQGEGGVVPLDPEFLQAVEAFCKENDVLLIIDEVQTGIGRTGAFFSYQALGLSPDIVTSAKGLGGGLPIGATLFAEKCVDSLGKGDHGSTYGGNPIAVAGALAVLHELTEEFLQDVSKKGEFLKEKLLSLPQVAEVSGRGLMLGVTLVGKAPQEVVVKGIAYGVLCLTAGNKLRLLPPLTITMEELAEGVDRLSKALADEGQPS